MRSAAGKSSPDTAKDETSTPRFGRKPRVKRPKQPRFSMIRSFQVADLLTLANGFSGAAAIFAVMKYLISTDRFYLNAVFGLLPAALLFDALDGRVARMRHEQSLLGQEMDSLADLVSFGVAPACLAFAVGMRGGWDAIGLVYFVACGLSRLARYNATAASLSDEAGKVKYFEGTPIPSSLIIVAFLGFLVSQDKFGEMLPLGGVTLGPWDLHPLVLVYVVSGSAMISKTLRIPKPLPAARAPTRCPQPDYFRLAPSSCPMVAASSSVLGYGTSSSRIRTREPSISASIAIARSRSQSCHAYAATGT